MVTLDVALSLALIIEPIAAANGCHIGLTGGLLYKGPKRKDMDFVVYKHNDPDNYGEPIPREAFEAGLERAGLTLTNHYARVTKAKWNDYAVDFIYAEQFGVYPAAVEGKGANQVEWEPF